MSTAAKVVQVGDKPSRARSGGGAKKRGSKVHHQNAHPQHHPIPSWVWPLLVNVLVLVAGVGTTWGLMKGDLSSVDLRLNSLTATVSAQIGRIDGIVKEQDRITRLEERLGNITSLLVEIKTDLKEGRYAVRRDGVIAPSAGK